MSGRKESVKDLTKNLRRNIESAAIYIGPVFWQGTEFIAIKELRISSYHYC